MNDIQKDTLVAWLNDAYAMEHMLVTELERQAGMLGDDLSMMKSKLKEHLQVTKNHAEKVAGCIERHGGNPSTTKKAIAVVSGNAQSIMMGMADDNYVKAAHSDYAAEQAEIASYTTLISAAEALGDTQTAAVCREILADEIEMAEWLIDQIPVVTAKYLNEQK